MTRNQLIDTLDKIGKRLEELVLIERSIGLTEDEKEDSIVLGDWLDELAHEVITEDETLPVDEVI